LKCFFAVFQENFQTVPLPFAFDALFIRISFRRCDTKDKQKFFSRLCASQITKFSIPILMPEYVRITGFYFLVNTQNCCIFTVPGNPFIIMVLALVSVSIIKKNEFQRLFFA